MDIFSVSLLESFYIIYMMNFFRTKYNFAHPLTYFKNDYLYHPVDKADKPRRMICGWPRCQLVPRPLFLPQRHP